ncbi:hypothetical protein XENOCAPTIV_005552 [Xenoophorus captivus]|uniref:Uncharacterized protein n=1 Tax=Xenoophorus captivus TaxID=1517983 RepID=A0ABV0RHN6_9TELE
MCGFRFGHGIFLLCLESVYKKLTGRDLEYAAVLGKPSLLTYQYAEQLLRQQNQNHKLSTIYAITFHNKWTMFLSSRDNLMTDIYGANLYNRYLAKHHTKMMSGTKLVAQGTGTQTMMAVEELAFAAQCRSILVGRNLKVH